MLSITAETQQKLFSFCTENGISEEHYRELTHIIGQENDSMWKANNEMARQKRDAETKVENQKKIMKEMGERFRSKLMSVYYMLGSIKKMGTHREKEVAVSYLLQTVDDLANKGNDMSWDQDWFELPF